MNRTNGSIPVKPTPREFRQAQEKGCGVEDIQLRNVEADANRWVAFQLESICDRAERQRIKWEARRDLARNMMSSVRLSY